MLWHIEFPIPLDPFVPISKSQRKIRSEFLSSFSSFRCQNSFPHFPVFVVNTENHHLFSERCAIVTNKLFSVLDLKKKERNDGHITQMYCTGQSIWSLV